MAIGSLRLIGVERHILVPGESAGMQRGLLRGGTRGHVPPVGRGEQRDQSDGFGIDGGEKLGGPEAL